MSIIIHEINIPLEAERIFASLYQPHPYAFWLDSNLLMPGMSRFSMMGASPHMLVTVNNGKTVVQYPTHTCTLTGNPFDRLEELFQAFSISSNPAPQLPLLAGWVGYMGFEMQKYLEKVPTHSSDMSQVSETCWMFFDQVLILDHVEEKAYISQYVSSEEKLSDVQKKLRQQEERIRQAAESPLSPCMTSGVTQCTTSKDIEFAFRPTETLSSYLPKINLIQEHILRGDIYQACFTYPTTFSFAVPPFSLYRCLRQINPAPFSSYLQMGDYSVLSSSPERFLKLDLKLDGERILESRPIKGTRPREEDLQRDQALAQELKESIKDRAENVMIVDLVRNDFGRVCLPCTVNVPKLFRVESYATVHQLVSIVTGQLKEEISWMDAIKSTFPGGSMTGAPKIRALEILHSLEKYPRGIYSGGLGYVDIRGSFDLSMVIRTLICAKGEGSFHVGGGIIADSDPMKEYQETLDKAYALKKAVVMAERGFGSEGLP